MKANHTHIVVLLDKSGSMEKVKADTIGGLNTFLEEQRKVPGEATITLYQFSDTCEATYRDVPLAHVSNLTLETYKPGGWTALNDALARAINEVGATLAAKPEHERPSNVIMLVMTDGEENKSIDFVGLSGRTKLAEMVKHQTEKYSWTFSFLGANIDAFHVGFDLGILRANILNYAASPIGTANAFKSFSRGTAAARISSTYGSKMDSFFENELNSTSIVSDSLDISDITDVIAKYTPITTPAPVAAVPASPADKTNP